MVDTMKRRLELSEISEVLNTIDWRDLECVRSHSYSLLRRIADSRETLGRLLASAIASAHLRNMFEHYDILDKLVLFDHRETGARLRLHVFLPGYFDRPHDHRWKYTTLILRGGYRHVTYLPKDYSSANSIRDMRPSIISDEREGHSYTYDAHMFHSITAEASTVTLVLRGPSEKEKFLVVDRASGNAWWQYGAAAESEHQRSAKSMTDEQLEATLNLLSEKRVALVERM